MAEQQAIVESHPEPIKSIERFVGLVAPTVDDATHKLIYRGEPEDYPEPLLPKVHREEHLKFAVVAPFVGGGGHACYGGIGAAYTEPGTLEQFKRLAEPHIERLPRDDWEWLAIAQHSGLATRLLDWTTDPLTALYFAVEKPNGGKDSVVWQLLHRGQQVTERVVATSGKKSYVSKKEASDPFQIESVHLLNPPHLVPRITQQSGSFTAHPPDHSMLTNYAEGKLLKITIAAEQRPTLRWQLAAFNKTRASLFPGLDGIAEYLTFQHTAPKP